MDESVERVAAASEVSETLAHIPLAISQRNLKARSRLLRGDT
jgi:hypothetical protein